MESIISIVYLVASVLFIFGIKMLASPKTARKGNASAALGMFLAIVVTLFDKEIVSFEYIIIGVLTGSIIGILLAYKTPMTNMPQMVGLLNGFGGGASILVALAEYYKTLVTPQHIFEPVTIITMMLSVIIGGVTFTGSLIAFGKLQGIVTGKAVKYKFQHPLNLLLIAGMVLLGVLLFLNPDNHNLLIAVSLISLLTGILLVLPIGGADMPVAVSLLNSYSGLAASATGFVLGNNLLIIAGALVGASGIILTLIMCKAMNRSIMNVVLGGWADSGLADAGGGAEIKGSIKSIDSEELAMLFDAAQNIIIIPGYGMAVAQAQHAVRDLVNLLEKKGKNVRFAIHPVAGRMPGHMNVLLAEANIPYDKLFALEDINDDFNQNDIALVIGANDVVNPAARSNPASPIYGMPILNADYSKTVVINKRSMNKGYAGIENELFYKDNSLMYFGDAKDAISKLTSELKNL